MNYIAVDDEPFALEDIEEALRSAAPGSAVHCFTAPGRALEYAGETPVDVAFLDIELGSMNGLVLAKKLKDLQPELHIIFVTSHEQYAINAFQLHASGYLMKPVTAEDIRRELTFAYGRAPLTEKVRVQTFGGFDVFVEGRPLAFGRAKAKELLAYLVDRRGSSVTTGELCAVLWEGEPKKDYLRVVLKELRKVLRDAGIERILIKTHNSFAVDAALLDCDSYRFLDGDPQAVNQYRRDYMPQYGWSEFSTGALDWKLE